MIKRFFMAIVGMTILVSGCTVGHKPASFEREEPVIELLDVLEHDNTEGLREMFAKNAIATIKTLDDDMKEVFQYYSGKLVSFTNPCGAADESYSSENGHTKVEKYWTYDVTTSECKYRMTFYEVAEDTKIPENIGIWSISIIKMVDDTDPEYAYWGDGNFTPGINIGIKNLLPSTTVFE